MKERCKRTTEIKRKKIEKREREREDEEKKILSTLERKAWTEREKSKPA
jgi:hypothetical protein